MNEICGKERRQIHGGIRTCRKEPCDCDPAKFMHCVHGLTLDRSCPQCAATTKKENSMNDIRQPYTPGERQPTPTAEITIGEPCPEGYEELDRVLFEAFGQAAHGKGKRRHANELAFPDQPIMKISSMVGLGGLAYQIMKKAQEAVGMNARGDHDAAIAECRGAIIYAAAAILLIEGKRDGSK